MSTAAVSLPPPVISEPDADGIITTTEFSLSNFEGQNVVVETVTRHKTIIKPNYVKKTVYDRRSIRQFNFDSTLDGEVGVLGMQTQVLSLLPAYLERKKAEEKDVEVAAVTVVCCPICGGDHLRIRCPQFHASDRATSRYQPAMSGSSTTYVPPSMRGGANREEQNLSVKFEGLPEAIGYDELREILGVVDLVPTNITFPRQRFPGHRIDFAYVTFMSPTDQAKCKKMLHHKKVVQYRTILNVLLPEEFARNRRK
eukprot:gnl/Dysnectes_brevis/853_a943_3475.p2 GENE.gnl/Dysnectes_brevis/853_a943_3475~~gnl/Dysnectes_brevis/853_a943_3475.p2  ORF type:complete len:255 (+),score=31.05 gnl/Dysnectes_brevis/853_a943_3475:44-808(+)